MRAPVVNAKASNGAEWCPLASDDETARSVAHSAFTVGSLFSGVGGFDLGFVRAGFDVRWQCEVDRDCKDVLAKRFPETSVIYDDVRTVNWDRVEPVDIIIGGFPCQDLSVAGRRAGLDGERSGLFFQFARVLDTVRPAIAVIENVPGLLSSAGGRDMAIVLGTLRDIGAVDIAWCVLDAQWFGVPQRRRRVFLVADFAGERASAILALREGLQGHPPPRRKAGEAVAGSIGGGTGARGWANDLDNSGAFVAHSLTGVEPDASSSGVCMCAPLGATRQTPEEEDGTGRGTPIIAIGLGSDPLYSTDLAQPVTGRNGDPGVIAVRTAQTGSNGWGVNEEETSYTLDGAQGQAVASSLLNPGKGGRTNDVDALNYVPAPMGVRRLTPTECERLMGWEDDHTRYGASGKEMSDSTRYRMCGNGVVSNVAYWIAARIKGALDD